MAASGRDHHRGRQLGVAYALPGAGVAVYADDPQLQDWLREFLAPGFERLAPADGHPTVVVTSDAGWSTPPAPPGHVGVRGACFALDREVVEYPAGIVDGATVVTDSRHGVCYRIEPEQVTVVRGDRAPRSPSGGDARRYASS